MLACLQLKILLLPLQNKSTVKNQHCSKEIFPLFWLWSLAHSFLHNKIHFFPPSRYSISWFQFLFVDFYAPYQTKHFLFADFHAQCTPPFLLADFPVDQTKPNFLAADVPSRSATKQMAPHCCDHPVLGPYLKKKKRGRGKCWWKGGGRGGGLGGKIAELLLFSRVPLPPLLHTDGPAKLLLQKCLIL